MNKWLNQYADEKQTHIHTQINDDDDDDDDYDDDADDEEKDDDADDDHHFFVYRSLYIYIYIIIYIYTYNVSMPCMFSLIFLRLTVPTIRSLQVAWGELCEAGLTELMTRLLVPSFSEAAMDRPCFFFCAQNFSWLVSCNLRSWFYFMISQLVGMVGWSVG